MMRIVLILSSLILLLRCSKDGQDPASCVMEATPDLRFFLFETSRGDRFVAWTSRTGVLESEESQLALPLEQRNQHINGAIRKNDDHCNPNFEWSWHFDPDDWDMADLSIELCDGDPHFVEENLQEFLRTGRYCPWSSKVLEEVAPTF